MTIKNPDYLDAGGFLGKTGFTLLDSVVGHGGTVLVFVMVFLISLMLSTQFSPYQLLAAVWRLMKLIFTLFEKKSVRRVEGKQREQTIAQSRTSPEKPG